MINQPPDRSWPRTLLLAAGVGCVMAVLALPACSTEEEPVAVAPRQPPPPPPPAPPKVKTIEDLMAELRIDSRVVFPEDKAPADTGTRKAILEFFDGFARGDATVVGSMLTEADRLELSDLEESGRWSTTAEGIEQIDIHETGTSDYGDCVLAVFDVDGDFQPQLWYYQSDGQGFTFEAAPSPPGIIDQLSGTNWIGSWHDILKAEMELANKPDEAYDAPQINLSESGSSGSSASPGGGKPGPGTAPPGRGRRPPSKRPPRKPPGVR